MTSLQKSTGTLRRLIVIFITFFALSFSMNAMAKPAKSPNDKVLVKEAAAAYEKGDFDTALTKFNEAYQIKPQSSLLYNIGRVYESKADYANAISYYKQFISTPGSDEDARSDAKDRIKDIQDTMAVLGGSVAAVPAAAPGAAVAAAAPAVAAGPCIDINTASASQLTDLKGVGAATADKIIAARPYVSIDDLNRVKGLGDAKIGKMRAQICPIGGAPAAAPAKAPIPAQKAAPAKAPIPAKKATPAPAKDRKLKSAGSDDIDI